MNAADVRANRARQVIDERRLLLLELENERRRPVPPPTPALDPTLIAELVALVAGDAA